MSALSRIQDWRGARREQFEQRSVEQWMASPGGRASQSYREQERTARECQELTQARNAQATREQAARGDGQRQAEAGDLEAGG